MLSFPAYAHSHREIDLTAPVLAWTVSIGNSPTITPGTWTGSPVLTYDLYRNGVVTGTINKTLAQANAYVTIAADIAPASVGGSPPSLTWLEKDVLASLSVPTNAVAFALPTASVKGDWDSFTAGHYTLASGRVSTAIDQSGASNDLTEGTASIQPTIATAGAPDGVHDAFNFALNAGAGVRLRKTAMGLSGQPVTIYSVVQVPASGRYVSDGGGTNNTRVIYDPAGASLVLFTVASGAVCSVAATPGAWAVVASVCNGAASAQSINGGAQSTGNLGSTTDDGHCMGTAPGLNANTCLNAKIARQIVYAAAHTASQVADVSAYLKGWAGL